MREKGKKMGACSTSFHQTSIMKSSILYKVLFGHCIPPKTMQITKMTKVVNYYRDNLGRKHKNEVKKSKEKGTGVRNFVGLRNFVGVAKLQNCFVSACHMVCLLVLQL